MRQGKPEYHAIRVSRTAHIYTLGKLTDRTKYIWLVCHGYGQSAERFIYKFDQLDENEHFVIAPEGLSRFYWNGVKGDVVSSWMTSKNRLNEIEDYCQYLDLVLSTFKNYSVDQKKFIFFGFSQGCATLLRYLAAFQPYYRDIILWAGSFPKDISYLEMSDYWDQGQIHLIFGDNDEYLTTEFVQDEEKFINEQELKVSRHVFEGKHRVDTKVLMEYLSKILSIG